ncbi:MAG TPA: photosynthetic reaction center subunit H [Burkholderiaceae bacterium]|nr:photosynthetic reaction center subunit H [Burkholderiaceae bacterium]
MQGASSYFDVAQVVLYAFWIFFALLVVYLLKENKREGYPLDSSRTTRSGGRVKVIGWPGLPAPKTFLLPHGGTVTVPNGSADRRPVAAAPIAPYHGAPLEPTGAKPLLDCVGPGSYAERSDTVDLTYEGEPKIVPMRVAADFSVARGWTPDPRGKPVFGADDERAGIVRDLWVDRSECILRYLEVEVPTGADSRRVLLPATFAVVDAKKVQVESILAAQFSDVPATKSPDQVTLLEEDRITAYYGAGTLYATRARREPFL